MKPNNMYNDSIDISREIKTVDSGGSPISTFTTIATGVACSVQDAISNEEVKGTRKYSQPSHMVYMDNATDITMKDVITYEGDDYDIVELDKRARTYTRVKMEKN